MLCRTRKCTCSSGKTGADCSINVNDYRTVVLGCGPVLPAPVAAVCRKATESGGPCKAYSLLAAEECVEICRFIQGGNCSLASREHVCTRNKVKCSGMVRNSPLHVSYCCALELSALAVQPLPAVVNRTRSSGECVVTDGYCGVRHTLWTLSVSTRLTGPFYACSS